MPARAIRQDLSASELRRLARHEPDRRAGMRLLAIANALEGFSRAEAARLAGPRAADAARCCADGASALPMLERQARRDAVLRDNAEGPSGLHDRPRSGRPEGLGPGQQAALKAWILPHPMPLAAWGPRRGPDPEKDGISAWRPVDICAHAERAYGVRYSEWGMSRLLYRLGLSRQKTRPRHPQGNPAVRAAFERWTWREARRDCRGSSGPAAGALVRG